MALLQISEPDGPELVGTKELKAVIGIDLGTTNSLVGYVDGQDATVKICSDDNGRALIKSVVTYQRGQIPRVGNRKLEGVEKESSTVRSVKRLIGKSIADMENSGRLDEVEVKELSGKEVLCVKTPLGLKTPVEISGEILKHMKLLAEKNLRKQIEGAVITVPAYFDDTQRQATKAAASMAGLKVLRLINEPTAAALAYGLDTKQQGLFMVYDLGGGTFDVSILHLEKGIFSVVATGGDTNLGGDDFDELIANHLAKNLPTSFDELNVISKNNLLSVARELKEKLSSLNVKKNDAVATLSLNNEIFELRLSSVELENLIGKLVCKTLKICDQALLDAELDHSELKEIVLVGGSTRLAIVRESILNHYGKNPMVDLNPDHVVCIGASLQADSLIGNRASRENWLLLDVTPLSLGIETMGGLVEKIIPRNTPIPVEKMKEFTTFKDGQVGMSIHVVQGERELVRDCRSLAKFEISNIPPMVAGKPRIVVSFRLDADGLLSVETLETSQGDRYSIEVNPSFGLTDEDVERIISESLDHSEADVQTRGCEEKKLELARTLEALTAALSVDSGLLETGELEIIVNAMNEARKALENGEKTKQEIEKVASELDKFVEPFAQKRMNEAIGSALKGQSVDDLS